jgi:hypothetical protein
MAVTGQRGMPAYPNLSAALGTNGPVVAALLSAISTATFVGAFPPDFRSANSGLFRLSWTSKDATIVFGVISTIAFVLAAASLVYAQASDFRSLPADAQERIFDDQGVTTPAAKEGWKHHYAARTLHWQWRGFALLNEGFVVLMLTIGSVTEGYAAGVSVLVMAGLVIVLVPTLVKPAPMLQRLGTAISVLLAIAILLGYFGVSG